ncbi:hypothetical protein AC579_6476 [Pseudocercospora musae]|uniref:Uncharacterized protein n=1 Tax=Pseudocercospora musae TaxID=113226 RepID=A0A139IKN9_9PEZI|nr:hypothetical protein AC579_6476 [Pseudocercospora musae]
MLPSLPTSDSNGSVVAAILLKPAVAVLLALSLFSIYILYPVVLNSLRSIAGPFLSRLTRLWELCPVVRLAPDRCSIQEPSALKNRYQ